MANTIKIKRSAVPAKVPTTGDLALGELALNTYDGKLYTKKDDGTASVVEIGAGGGGGSSTLTISAKTSAYTVVAGDLGTIINCTSGTFTVSLTAAATLGSGFNCWIWNTSATATHAITIDPDGAETIDGVATLILRRGEGTQIVCDGTNFQTGDKKTMRAYAENSAASSPRPIATGSNSIALGGSRASGVDSFAAAIANNTATYGAQGANSVAIGYLSDAEGWQSFAVSGGLSDGDHALSFGGGSRARFSDCIALQRGAFANADKAIAIGGRAVSNVQTKIARGTIAFAPAFNSGEAQSGDLVLVSDTTDATPEALTANNGTAGPINQIILPNNSAYAFHGTIVARQQASGGTACAAWKIEGLIRREANAASTVLVNSATTVLDNAPLWGMALSADITNGGLKIEVTGAAATNIRWVATINTSECTF